MVVIENNIVKEVEKLNWLRILLILLSFAAGIVLIHLGQVRVAISMVGVVMLLCSIGYYFLKNAVIRSMSAKTGKPIAQLLEELKKR